MDTPPGAETCGIKKYSSYCWCLHAASYRGVAFELPFYAGHYSSGDSYYSTNEDEADNSAKITALEDLLATKLAEYLDSTFSYSLTKLLSVAQAHLYKGPPESIAIQ